MLVDVSYSFCCISNKFCWLCNFCECFGFRSGDPIILYPLETCILRGHGQRLKDTIDEAREEYLQRTVNRKAHVEDAYFDDFRGPFNYRAKRVLHQNLKDHMQKDEDDDNMSELTSPPVVQVMEGKLGGETETDPKKKSSDKKKGMYISSNYFFSVILLYIFNLQGRIDDFCSRHLRILKIMTTLTTLS